MKLKSPFNLFSLSAPTADLRGNYANPQIGKYKPTTFKHPKLSDIKNQKPKPKPEPTDSNTSSNPLVIPRYQDNLQRFSTSVQNRITTTPGSTKIIPGSNQGNTGVNAEDSFNKLKKDEKGNAMRTGDFEGGTKQDWNAYLKSYWSKKNSTIETTPGVQNTYGQRTINGVIGKEYLESSKPINMKGSPNKLIGDTMDPYGQINPGAVPPNQAQNDLGAQPIIGAQGSQPSPRSIDMAAIGNPYATPGADFSPQSRMKAESMYGSSGQRQGLMNLGTPLHNKGHEDDYEGHTHRVKGGSYKKGDYMDETDMETSYPKLHTQDVGEIKRDKKSQFMVSKNEDYNPTKIDTIRPSKGKEFKMSWGDAERNISTNPKYPRSN